MAVGMHEPLFSMSLGNGDIFPVHRLENLFSEAGMDQQAVLSTPIVHYAQPVPCGTAGGR